MPTKAKEKTAVIAEVQDYTAVPLMDDHDERQQRDVLPVQTISGVTSVRYQRLEPGKYAFPNQGRMVTFLSVINPGKKAVDIHITGLIKAHNIDLKLEINAPVDIGPLADILYNRIDQLVFVDVKGGPVLVAIKRLGV